MEYTYKAPSNTERTGIRPTAIAATNVLIEGMTRGLAVLLKNNWKMMKEHDTT